MPPKLTTAKFIEKSRAIHGDRYDYSKVEYLASETKICIICKKHGEFWQTPHRHLMGDNCPKCGPKAKIDSELFEEKARKKHGDRYDYSKVNYIDSKTKVCIICPEHGEFWQNPIAHINMNGCPVCSAIEGGVKNRIKKDDFIKRSNEIHCNTYEYDKVEYITNNVPVIITCKTHGDFKQTPSKHLQGHGCPICGSSGNIGEMYFEKKLKTVFENVEYQKTFPFLQNGSGVQKLDFYLPEYGVGIEFNGKQHYIPIDAWGGKKALELSLVRDKNKFYKCKENGIVVYYFSPHTIKKYTENYFEKVYTSFDELIKEIKKIGYDNRL